MKILISLILAISLSSSATAFTLDNIGLEAIKHQEWKLPGEPARSGIDGSGVVILSIEGFNRQIGSLQQCYTPERYALTIVTPVRFSENGDPYLNDLPTNTVGLSAALYAGHGTMSAATICVNDVENNFYGVAPNATIWSINQNGASTNLTAWFQLLESPIIITASLGSNRGEREDLQFGIGFPADVEALLVWGTGNTQGSRSEDSFGLETEHQPILRVAGARWDKSKSMFWEGIEGKPETYPSISAPGCFISIRDPLAGASTLVSTTGFEEFSELDCPFFSPTPAQRANFTYYGGSSGATPQVAGVAALMLQVNPGLSALQVRELIRATGDPFITNPTQNTTDYSPEEFFAAHGRMAGYGYVNASLAVGSANLWAWLPALGVKELVECARVQLGLSGGVLNSNPDLCLAGDFVEPEFIVEASESSVSSSESMEIVPENKSSPSVGVLLFLVVFASLLIQRIQKK